MSLDRNDKPLQVRKPCGHYAPLGEHCPSCDSEGGSPDPWEMVTKDTYRDEVSRMYRQSKYRNYNDGS